MHHRSLTCRKLFIVSYHTWEEFLNLWNTSINKTPEKKCLPRKVYTNYSYPITINSHGLCELFVNFATWSLFVRLASPCHHYDGPGSKVFYMILHWVSFKKWLLIITPLQNENHIQVVDFQPSLFRSYIFQISASFVRKDVDYITALHLP